MFRFSHEKKKEYWDQLESRCRYLHRRLGVVNPNAYLHPAALAGSLPVSISAANLLQQSGAASAAAAGHCDCCAAAAAAGMVHDSTFEERYVHTVAL